MAWMYILYVRNIMIGAKSLRCVLWWIFSLAKNWKILKALLEKVKSNNLKKGKGKRNNIHTSTAENSQVYRDVLRTNQSSKLELFAKIVTA